MPRVQFKCYGDSPLEANGVYQALADCLENDKTYEVMSATLESGSIDLREPDTDWPYVLSFWRIVVRNTDKT